MVVAFVIANVVTFGFTRLLLSTLLRNNLHTRNLCYFLLTLGSQPQCAEAFDLGFVVDSSGSIQDMNYKKQKDFIKGLANALTVSPQTVQLGLILFSDVPLLSITFGTLTSTNYSEFAKAVDHMIYLKGRTRIDRALQVAVTNLFPGGRQNRMPQILFLITDGRHKSNDLGAVGLEQAVQPLKDKKIKVTFYPHHSVLANYIIGFFFFSFFSIHCYRLRTVLNITLLVFFLMKEMEKTNGKDLNRKQVQYKFIYTL